MPDNPRPDLILIGEILGPHGLRGEVKLRSFAQEPAAIADYSPLTSVDGVQSVAIGALRPAGAQPEIFVARIEGVNAREAAEALTGLRLYMPRARVAPSDDEEFLHADLIGCRVELADGTVIGEVVAMQNFGAGDLVEVALSGRRSTEYLPFTREFVPGIDLAARRIIVAVDPTPLSPGA